MGRRPRLLVTVGDPAGVGPLVTVAALSRLPDLLRSHQVTVIGTRADLGAAASRLDLTWQPVELPRSAAQPEVPAGRVALFQPEGVDRICPDPATPGRPTAAGGRAQLAFVDAALEAILGGRADALVTGPVSKISICRECGPFSGHTEHLARAAGVAEDQVTMMFAGPRLRVALLTTHLPLGEVPRALTAGRINDTLVRVVGALRTWWKIPRPRVVVLGLNPHAGEEGLLGDEERAVIAPAVAAFRASEAGSTAEISGPLPSEVGLRGCWEGKFDAALAHYHDQATIPCKLLEMGSSVNVTLGLPFLRTSVDHGTAYDAAEAGTADPGSMIAALGLAGRLTGERSR